MRTDDHREQRHDHHERAGNGDPMPEFEPLAEIVDHSIACSPASGGSSKCAGGGEQRHLNFTMVAGGIPAV